MIEIMTNPLDYEEFDFSFIANMNKLITVLQTHSNAMDQQEFVIIDERINIPFGLEDLRDLEWIPPLVVNTILVSFVYVFRRYLRKKELGKELYPRNR